MSTGSTTSFALSLVEGLLWVFTQAGDSTEQHTREDRLDLLFFRTKGANHG
jgi:hypothetical protein